MEFSSEIIKPLSIDCIVAGFKQELNILLVKHASGISKGKWALPGGWIQYNESLDDAAGRILKALTGLSDIYLKQLRAFGELHRFPSKRVITVAYSAFVKYEEYEIVPGFTASDAKWFPLKEIPDMPYDHNYILNEFMEDLRFKVKREPIGFQLLPEKFTLLQLQELYESILGVNLDKPNFRRKIRKMNLLVDCQEKQEGMAHRSPKLYRFDVAIYEKLKEKGFNFEF